MLRRRTLLKSALTAAALAAVRTIPVRADEKTAPSGVRLPKPLPGEDLFAFLQRTGGRF